MNNEIIRKTTAAEFAIKSLNEEGWFEGYASTFGNEDQVGDIFEKGAFKRTLSHRAGGKVPILLNHQKDLIAGYNYDAKEDEKGLWVRGKLNLSTEVGRTAHFYLKSAAEAGGDGGLSIGFLVPQGGSERRKDGQGMIFRECALKEYSVTPWPCNTQALVTSIKNHEDAPEQAKTMILPAISIEQALKASRGEDADLSPEQLAGLTAFADAIKLTEQESSQEQKQNTPAIDVINKGVEQGIDKLMPPVDDDTTTPITFQQALARANAQEQQQEERWKLEQALYSAIDSIKESALDYADMKMALSDAYSAYAQSMVAWHMATLQKNAKLLLEMKAIKGMNTADHVEMQGALASASVHLQEGRAARDKSDKHYEKAHGIVSRAVKAYAATDFTNPNGPTAPAPTKPKGNDTPLDTKSAEDEVDEKALSELIEKLMMK